MYFSNDFAEAYRAVYVEKRGQALRLSDDTVERVSARTAVDNPAGFPPPVEAAQEETVAGPRQWLSEHSSLYGLVRAVYRAQFEF